MNWYYDAGGGNRQGPITDAALDELAAAGSITPDTLVWCDGMKDWAPLRVARPSAVGSSLSSEPSSTERCDACGLFVPASELIKIGPSNVCASCKPVVLQQLQQGRDLPALDRNGPAWEERSVLGIWSAAIATIKAVLLKPAETFSTMRREGGVGNPLFFHVLTGTIGGVVGLLYNVLFNPSLRQPQVLPNLTIPAFTDGMFFGWALMMPIFIVLGAFIQSGLFHLSLMICGGARQPFETTFRVTAYTFGAAAILQVIPVCGATLYFIWGLVCFCIGLAKAHEIETGRAVGAVLLPLVLCCALSIVFFGAIFAAIGAAQGG